MKYITLLLLLSISTLCCAMDESYASEVPSGEVSSGERKSHTNAPPPGDGSTKSSHSEGETEQETDEELFVSPRDFALEYVVKSPAKGKGGSMKEIMPAEEGDGYYVGRDDEWVLVEGDEEPLPLYMIAERKVPELEEIEFLASPKRIATYCNNIAAAGDGEDTEIQRKVRHLAMKNLQAQEELARTMYDIKPKSEKYMPRFTKVKLLREYRKLLKDYEEAEGREARLILDKIRVTREKIHLLNETITYYTEGQIRRENSMLATYERVAIDVDARVQRLNMKILDEHIQRNNMLSDMPESTAEIEFKKHMRELLRLEKRMTELALSLINMKRAFNEHISKVAAMQAVKKVREIKNKKTEKMFKECVAQ